MSVRLTFFVLSRWIYNEKHPSPNRECDHHFSDFSYISPLSSILRFLAISPLWMLERVNANDVCSLPALVWKCMKNFPISGVASFAGILSSYSVTFVRSTFYFSRLTFPPQVTNHVRSSIDVYDWLSSQSQAPLVSAPALIDQSAPWLGSGWPMRLHPGLYLPGMDQSLTSIEHDDDPCI